MDRNLGLTLLLVLLLCHKGNSESLCPYKCQCFTPVQVFCADERLMALPSNMSTQVEDFILMISSVSYLFTHTFKESPQLTKLVFLNNTLISIHAMAFESLTELQELEISGNPSLENLFLETFSKQRKLIKLFLNHNGLKTVPPGTFDSLTQLQTLQMKGNIISYLPTFLFLHLHKLRVLDLSQNKLTGVTRETFSGLSGLEILKLNNNFISNLTSDMFHNMSQLTELHMEWNKIAQLSDDVFSMLPSLKVLNLRGNLLTTFSEKVFGFQPSNLSELNLKGNRLTQLSSLSSLTSLADIDLSSNRLSMLPEDIFLNITFLETIDVSENQLTSLPERIFNDLFIIKSLYLHRNNLTKLDTQLFRDQSFLQQLYLSENQLETLPPGLLDPFIFQPTLRLHGNPWKCDCQIRYLHDWVLSSSRDIEMLDRVLCGSPGYLRNHAVASIDENQLVCQMSKDEHVQDLSTCRLQASNDTFIIKCKVDKCSPHTVKVQFQEEDGSIKEHIVKNEVDHSQCTSNKTTTIQ
ncbi:carboxypeptidase N subunit 2 [Mugil cephalus]|uniref:carboxypeptidase N subunit 2 n=1 Tax=Mugil cephalus TaxID=48193 RepID=UPI001FB58F41|nr:carboxypeptidase N subunit 2 [Mugil cephalus]